MYKTGFFVLLGLVVVALPLGSLAAPAAAAVAAQTLAIPGDAFVAQTWTIPFQDTDFGCLQASSGTFHAAVNLPDGSVVTSVILGYNNQGSLISNTIAGFEAIKDKSFAVTTEVFSGTAVGFHTATQADNDAIDNSAKVYEFIWYPDSSGRQELCYMKVVYIPPSIFGVALPVVRR